LDAIHAENAPWSLLLYGCLGQLTCRAHLRKLPVQVAFKPPVTFLSLFLRQPLD